MPVATTSTTKILSDTNPTQYSTKIVTMNLFLSPFIGKIQYLYSTIILPQSHTTVHNPCKTDKEKDFIHLLFLIVHILTSIYFHTQHLQYSSKAPTSQGEEQQVFIQLKSFSN